jgi:hypothetical protein
MHASASCRVRGATRATNADLNVKNIRQQKHRDRNARYAGATTATAAAAR